MDKSLDQLLKEAVEKVKKMTPEEYNEMIRLQRESWVRGESAWPEPKYHWEGDTKVYESYEDYCNA